MNFIDKMIRKMRSKKIMEQAMRDFKYELDEDFLNYVKGVLFRKPIRPGSQEDILFWEDMESKVPVPKGSTLRDEVVRHFRKEPHEAKNSER